jgi:phosphatidate cytidylyltransferase
MPLPRVMTALVGIPALLFLIHLGSFPFLALCVAAAVLSGHEYATMLAAGGRLVQRVLSVLSAGALALAVGLSGPVPGAPPLPGVGLDHAAATLVAAAAFLRELFRRDHSLDRAGLTVAGAFLIGWPLGHLPLLRNLCGPGEEALGAAPLGLPMGEGLTLLLFVSVWCSDVAAYAAGSAFGSRRMAPVVSPKKTWEGAAAGFFAAMIASFLVGRALLPPTFAAWRVLGLGGLVGTLGQVSDLAQSLVKRASGVKDSSSLLPGHGGVFERMDSFLLLAPVFYYFVVLTG